LIDYFTNYYLVNQAYDTIDLDIEDEENTNVENDTTVLNDESTCN